MSVVVAQARRTRPVTLKEARRFVAEHHRHNGAPVGWRFGTGLEIDGELVGVAVASDPTGPWADSLHRIEIVRCCTIGHRNACSMLYGAICRAGAALGFDVAITYTLASEDGASLKAAGFVPDADLAARGYGGGRPRYEGNLLGEATRPEEAKRRWTRQLRGHTEPGCGT